MPGVLRGEREDLPSWPHRRPAEARSRGSAGDPSGHPIMTSSQLCPQPPRPSSWGTGPGGAKELRETLHPPAGRWAASWLNCWPISPFSLALPRSTRWTWIAAAGDPQ